MGGLFGVQNSDGSNTDDDDDGEDGVKGEDGNGSVNFQSFVPSLSISKKVFTFQCLSAQAHPTTSTFVYRLQFGISNESLVVQ